MSPDPTAEPGATAAATVRAHAADLRLAQLARVRDPRAVDQLVERMRVVPRFLTVLNGRTGSGLTAEDLMDVAQDVLTLVWDKLHVYAGHAALESWMFQICLFELRNAARRRRRQQAMALDHVAEPSTEAVAVEDMATVLRRLDSLASEDRHILLRRHFDHQSFDQLAAELGMPVNTVKSRFYRALTRLREMFDRPEEAR